VPSVVGQSPPSSAPGCALSAPAEVPSATQGYPCTVSALRLSWQRRQRGTRDRGIAAGLGGGYLDVLLAAGCGEVARCVLIPRPTRKAHGEQEVVVLLLAPLKTNTRAGDSLSNPTRKSRRAVRIEKSTALTVLRHSSTRELHMLHTSSHPRGCVMRRRARSCRTRPLRPPSASNGARSRVQI